jgi:hypothetical protein
MKNKRWMLVVMTSMSVFLLGTSLYGQQDVNPTWYSPWSVPSQVVAHPPQPRVAKRKNQPKIVSGLPARQTGKLAAKQLVSRQAQSQIADRTFSPRTK